MASVAPAITSPFQAGRRRETTRDNLVKTTACQGTYVEANAMMTTRLPLASPVSYESTQLHGRRNHAVLFYWDPRPLRTKQEDHSVWKKGQWAVGRQLSHLPDFCCCQHHACRVLCSPTINLTEWSRKPVELYSSRWQWKSLSFMASNRSCCSHSNSKVINIFCCT